MKCFQRNFFNESGVFNHGKSSYWSKDVSRMSHYPPKCPTALNALNDFKDFIVKNALCRRRQPLNYILIFPIKIIYLYPQLNWGIVPINLKLIVFNRNDNETLCHTATYDAACRYRTRFRPLSRLGCQCQRRPVVRGWRFLRCITNYKP